MKVECPSCQTKYNLPDDKVGPEGANVRCSVCKHVFHVDARESEDFPGFGEAGAAPEWPVEDSGGHGEAALGGFDVHLESERKRDRFDDAGVSSSEFTSIDFGGPEKKASGLSVKTVLVGAVLGLLILAGIAGSAAYFFEFWPFAKKPAASTMQDANTPPAKPEQPDYLSQIQIASHEYYFVENEKVGKLFVISGKLLNKSPLVLRGIEMEASIMDAQDAPLETITFKAGPKATNFELKTLNKEDLESRLISKQEIMLYNDEVKTGDEVPFMVAFIKPPDTMKNYSLKIKTFSKVVPADAKPEGQEKK
ncbi:MAG: DUF3426 domain-containing protein [Thermodesulfobacteriota bacterium]